MTIKEILALEIPGGKYYYAMGLIRNVIDANTRYRFNTYENKRYGKSLCDAFELLYKIHKKEVIILERKKKNDKR